MFTVKRFLKSLKSYSRHTPKSISSKLLPKLDLKSSLQSQLSKMMLDCQKPFASFLTSSCKKTPAQLRLETNLQLTQLRWVFPEEDSFEKVVSSYENCQDFFNLTEEEAQKISYFLSVLANSLSLQSSNDDAISCCIDNILVSCVAGNPEISILSIFFILLGKRSLNQMNGIIQKVVKDAERKYPDGSVNPEFWRKFCSTITFGRLIIEIPEEDCIQIFLHEIANLSMFFSSDALIEVFLKFAALAHKNNKNNISRVFYEKSKEIQIEGAKNNSILLLNYLDYLAQASELSGDYDLAVSFYFLKKDLIQEVENKYSRQHCLNELKIAELCQKAGRFQEAQSRLYLAFEGLTEHFPNSLVDKELILKQLLQVHCFFGKDQLKKIVEDFLQVRQEREKNTLLQEMAALGDLCDIFLQAAVDYDICKEYLEKYIVLLKQSPTQSNKLAKALWIKGILLYSQGDQSRSVEWFQEAMEASKERNKSADDLKVERLSQVPIPSLKEEIEKEIEIRGDLLRARNDLQKEIQIQLAEHLESIAFLVEKEPCWILELSFRLRKEAGELLERVCGSFLKRNGWNSRAMAWDNQYNLECYSSQGKNSHKL